MLIAAVIAIGLFSFQARGSERVAWAFGPVMVLWFSSLAVCGLIALVSAPQVLFAINPMYGINYLLHNGLAGFLILSSVILCATGGEALYADMGHLGREPDRPGMVHRLCRPCHQLSRPGCVHDDPSRCAQYPL